jgi:hypothetical protein
VWELLKRAAIPLRIGAAIAAVYLGYVFLARHVANERWAASHRPPGPDSEEAAKFNATFGGTAVKILQFYARDGAIGDGESTVICYGVVNAKSLRIDPAVDRVYPALNRCVEVSPRHDTKYTLTAEGNDGHTESAEFTLTVRPDAGNAPRITSFGVAKHSYEQGHHYFTISFSFENANTVSIDPPVFSPLTDSAPFGQWTVVPEKTTTYTLTVTDKKGRKASKQLKVEVPGS